MRLGGHTSRTRAAADQHPGQQQRSRSLLPRPAHSVSVNTHSHARRWQLQAVDSTTGASPVAGQQQQVGRLAGRTRSLSNLPAFSPAAS